MNCNAVFNNIILALLHLVLYDSGRQGRIETTSHSTQDVQMLNALSKIKNNFSFMERGSFGRKDPEIFSMLHLLDRISSR